jgi:hypothetical protein
MSQMLLHQQKHGRYFNPMLDFHAVNTEKAISIKIQQQINVISDFETPTGK